MNELLVVVGVIALVWTVVRLWIVIARDGYGSVPPPRSHREELGTWADRQLQR